METWDAGAILNHMAEQVCPWVTTEQLAPGQRALGAVHTA